MSKGERRFEIVAATIAHALVARGAVSGLTEEKLADSVLAVLRDDRAREVAIDDEAKALMKKHAGEITREGMDPGRLFQKFRTQIAKERGFIL